MSKPFSAEHLQGLRLQLAQSNPRNLAILHAAIDPSPGQIKFMDAIVSPDPRYRNLIAKVHTQAGKTISVAVSLAYLFLHNPKLRWFHLAGSFLQASRLYDYFKPIVTNSELFPDALEGEPTRYLTSFKQGGRLEVLTASAKSIRGGAVDGVSIDEVVCVPMHLIVPALSRTRASKFPKRVLTSTASAEENLAFFLDLWQRAPEKHFERFEWPLSECHWISKQDSEDAKLLLDSQTYHVEFEGGIAQRTGLVWDNALIDRALVDPRKAEEYPPLAADPLTEKWTSLDWCFIGQAVLLFCEKQAETVYVRDCRIWSKESYTSIKQEIKEDFGDYPIYPDSEAVADNEDLKKMGMQVIPVIFSKEKDFLISRVRWRLEKGLLKIPNPDITDLAQGIDGRKYFTLVQQMKAYHYNEKTGKPEKVNDHCCDSLICAMKHVDQPIDRSKPIFRSAR